MSDCMHFPDTVEEFMEQYKMTDTKQVYSNGTEYVPIFRMKQWFEHEKAQLSHEGTTKDATSDTISRQAAIDELRKFKPEIIPYEKARIYVEKTVETMYDRIVELPSIQPEQCGDKSYTLWKESYEELKRRMDELTSCSDIISRQAAIDALDFEIVHMTAYCDGKNEGNPFAQYNKGLEDGKKAIEALPTIQPVATDTNVGDTISRQVAVDVLHGYFDGMLDTDTVCPEDIYGLFECIPSAQPETAKRIVGKSRDGMTLWYQCDMCNEPVDEQDNYCRGCGRRLIDG